MKETNIILNIIVSIILTIFLLIPIALNMYIQDMKYKEYNKNTEYRRSKEEMGIEDDLSCNME